MALDGEQYERIHDALTDAYDESTLQQMLRFKMNEDLSSLVEPGNLTDRIFKLIDWADRTGRIDELVQAAYRRNPGNEKLTILYSELSNRKNDAEDSRELIQAKTTVSIDESVIYDKPTEFFHDRIRRAFPGVEYMRWIDDPRVAIDRLSILLKSPTDFDRAEGYGCFTDPVWWFRGHDSMYVMKFESVDDTHCLINQCLTNIRRIAVVRPARQWQDFVYVEAVADEPTGLYKRGVEHSEYLDYCISTFGYAFEEYALLGNIPITRQEFDDGYAEIDGEIVNAQEAEVQVRYLTPFNFILTSKGSPYNSNEFEEQSRRYFDDLLLGKDVFADFIALMKSLPKHRLDAYD